VGHYFAGGNIDAMRVSEEGDDESPLTLNILTPAVDRAERPVLVYIHGGSYAGGSALIAASAQGMPAQENVVLVSINHRLNAFGFLYLEEIFPELQGSANPGMSDIVLALNWVRDNIASFGGDPDNVTIFGESGGGAKVTLLLGMPSANGLYRRAIVQSSPPLEVKTPAEGTALARTVLDRLGVADLESLRAVPGPELAGAAGGFPGILAPIVDGHIIPTHPLSPEAIANSAGVPLIIGHCEDEFRMFADLDASNEDALGTLERIVQAATVPALLDLYRIQHPEWSTVDIYCRAISDGTFHKQATLFADAKATAGDDVYRYRFSYVPPLLDGRYGAFHTAELPLVLRHVLFPESEDLSIALARAWAEFGRRSAPGTPQLPWARYTTGLRSTMVFDRDPKTLDDPDGDARETWSNLPFVDMDKALFQQPEAS
jgi:para-nitrobenzyl esterase